MSRMFCTVKQAAETLHASEDQINALLERGILPEFRQGPHRLLRTADVGALDLLRVRGPQAPVPTEPPVPAPPAPRRSGRPQAQPGDPARGPSRRHRRRATAPAAANEESKTQDRQPRPRDGAGPESRTGRGEGQRAGRPPGSLPFQLSPRLSFVCRCCPPAARGRPSAVRYPARPDPPAMVLDGFGPGSAQRHRPVIGPGAVGVIGPRRGNLPGGRRILKTQARPASAARRAAAARAKKYQARAGPASDKNTPRENTAADKPTYGVFLREVCLAPR